MAVSYHQNVLEALAAARAHRYISIIRLYYFGCSDLRALDHP